MITIKHTRKLRNKLLSYLMVSVFIEKQLLSLENDPHLFPRSIGCSLKKIKNPQQKVFLK